MEAGNEGQYIEQGGREGKRTVNHRLTLRREWIGNGGIVNFVMLNPSTADDNVDDPTIRKCCGFAKRWGFRGIVVTNLFAFRATDPGDLHNIVRRSGIRAAIGPDNDETIASAAADSDLVVFAWGVNAARYDARVLEVMRLVLPHHPAPYCIGFTKGGHPLHPCMAGYTEVPIIFESLAQGVGPDAAAGKD